MKGANMGKPEESELDIWIGESRCYYGKDKIGYITVVGEVDSTVAGKYSEAGSKIINAVEEGHINFLVDVNKAGKLSPEARGIFKEFSEHEKTGKVAIFGMHPVARVIASFVMGTAKKKDMRFFKTREEALAWLKE
jgi:hypothetical protein